MPAIEFCKLAFEHEPKTTCSNCGLEVDKYGNTEGDFRNCSFPDCGCDGARLCMAPSGASENSLKCNVESMYRRKDREAIRAKMGLLALIQDSKGEAQ
jgi:hypothetical protein